MILHTSLLMSRCFETQTIGPSIIGWGKSDPGSEGRKKPWSICGEQLRLTKINSHQFMHSQLLSWILVNHSKLKTYFLAWHRTQARETIRTFSNT